MTKKSKTTFGIFAESIGLYFSNFDKFLKYMTFPVLGQILGLGIVLVFLYFFTENMPKFIEKYPNLNDINTLIIFSIIITLPGLAIFCKAFWEYLKAYVAVNSMLDNMLKSGKVYDFKAHSQVAEKRVFQFIGLWFILGIFGLLAAFPLLWVIGGIVAVYLVLVFQVFTFEPKLSPIGCIKRSFNLIKGHFGSTFVLLILNGILTCFLIPQIFVKLSELSGFANWLSGVFLPIANLIPDINLQDYGLKPITSFDISKIIVESIILQIIIQYTLPQRSILWSLWYKEQSKKGESNIPQTKKRNSKRPSEKLMEETNKKYSKKKKIDKNILRRAMEKDDEE